MVSGTRNSLWDGSVTLADGGSAIFNAQLPTSVVVSVPGVQEPETALRSDPKSRTHACERLY